MKSGSWRDVQSAARAADRAADRAAADKGLPGMPKEELVRFIDISPPINDAIKNWPGDIPYKMEKSSDVHKDGIDIGSMHTSFHVGAHTDAHRHYATDGPDAATMPLTAYYGPCQVIETTTARGKRILPAHLTSPITTPRVLLKTGTFPDPTEWNEDFAAPDPKLIDHLADAGCILVGLDTPSTDLFASKGLEAHKRLFARGMVNLEGLVLAHVKPGTYTLIALPLRLEGADASPVRAVLIP
ncbi:MAG: cyclase family protein [bacterium]